MRQTIITRVLASQFALFSFEDIAVGVVGDKGDAIMMDNRNLI